MNDDDLGLTRLPVYGPAGQTYHLTARCFDKVLSEWYWTAREALDRRDELYDNGWEHVRIAGLPGVV